MRKFVSQFVPHLAFSLSVATALVTVLAVSPADARSKQPQPRPTPKSGVIAMLQEIQSEVSSCNEQLTSLRSEIDGVRNELDVLGQDLRPCTSERFLAGNCGDDQHPFNLVVSLCGNIGAEARVGGSFSLENHNTLEVGAGWDEIAHVNFDRQFQFPGIPGLGLAFPPAAHYGLPVPDLMAGAGGYGELEVSGCIEGVTIPIGAEISRARVVALIGQLEEGARDLLASQLRSLEQRELTPGRIAAAIDAVENFQENPLSPAELGMKDPLEIFQGGPLREVANALPVGSRLQALLDDPTEFIPSLGLGVVDTVGSVTQLCDGDISERPTLEAALVPICDLLEQTPTFERLTASLELIGDLPEEITAAIAELLPEIDAGASIPPPRTGDQRRICNTLPFLPRCR